MHRVGRLYHVYITRDPHCLALHTWKRDNRKEDLRLQYPLDRQSVVLDVGGFEGDYAASVREKFKSSVYVYEPVSAIYDRLETRLGGDEKCHLQCYGLAGKDAEVEISLDENASSTYAGKQVKDRTETIQIKGIIGELGRLNLTNVALIKINIEGGEYDLLERLIEAGKLTAFENILVQFHSFVDHAQERRQNIRESLRRSHTLKWDYPFVWESWKRR